MHDVQQPVEIVDARYIHAELSLICPGDLRREHRGFPEKDGAAFAEVEPGFAVILIR